jgi:hypothetical protein
MATQSQPTQHLTSNSATNVRRRAGPLRAETLVRLTESFAALVKNGELKEEYKACYHQEKRAFLEFVLQRIRANSWPKIG